MRDTVMTDGWALPDDVSMNGPLKQRLLLSPRARPVRRRLPSMCV